MILPRRFRSIIPTLELSIWPFIVAALMLVLALPALNAGFTTDDLFHRALLKGAPELAARGFSVPSEGMSVSDAAMRLFAFFRLEDGSLQAMKAYGSAPWWADPQVKLAFWRPLTAMTHWLDYKMWPDSALIMHLHSVLWFSVMIIAVGYLYRRLCMPTWVASIAIVIFALDISFMGAIAWLANRNIFLAVTFAALALVFHDDWRRNDARYAKYAAFAFFLLGLLSAEAGMGFMAYLLAYACFVDMTGLRSRLMSLMPYAAIFSIWYITYGAMGYGSAFNALYTSPAQEPMQFLQGVLERFPVLLFSEFAGVDGFYPAVRSDLQMWLLGFMLISLLGFFILIGPLVRRDPLMRFFLLGCCLALVPVSAMAIPSGRLLFFASLGGAGVLAKLLEAVLERTYWVTQNAWQWRICKWSGYAVTFMHIGFALMVWLAVNGYAWYQGFPDSARSSAWLEVDAGVPQDAKPIVIVNHPSPFQILYLPFHRWAYGLPIPASLEMLAPGFKALSLTRVHESSVLITVAEGWPLGLQKSLLSGGPAISGVYVNAVYGRLFLSHQRRFESSQLFTQEGLRVRIVETNDSGMPITVKFDFSEPLNAQNQHWVYWDFETNKFQTFVLPDIGQTVIVNGPFTKATP